MRTYRQLVCVAFLLTLSTAILTSGNSSALTGDSAATVTLDECIATAYENSPALLSMNEKVSAAEAGFRLAGSQALPILSLNETISRTNSPVMSFMSILSQERFTLGLMNGINSPEEITNFNTKLSLQVPVYNGGKVRAGRKMAGHAAEAAKLERDRKRQEVRMNVVEAYMGSLLAQEGLIVADEAYKTAQAHVKMAADHLDAGTVVKSDLLSAEVRLAQIEEMKLETENMVQLSRASLFHAMGVSQDMDVVLDAKPLMFRDESFVLDEIIKNAKYGRAELKMLMEYGLAGKEAVAVAKAGKKPSLNLMVQYDMDGQDALDKDGESWFAGAVVTMNIYDGGRTRNAADQAISGRNETNMKKEELRQGIELQVRQAFLDIMTAKRRIAVTSKAVEQAQESLRIVENRYENGLTTIVEVLKSETELTEANLRQVTALHDYAVGFEKLQFAAGAN